jgi:hypothetical protein
MCKLAGSVSKYEFKAVIESIEVIFDIFEKYRSL